MCTEQLIQDLIDVSVTLDERNDFRDPSRIESGKLWSEFVMIGGRTSLSCSVGHTRSFVGGRQSRRAIPASRQRIEAAPPRSSSRYVMSRRSRRASRSRSTGATTTPC